MLSYSNDPTIRFDHTPVINKIAFQVNQIGPDDPYVFPEVDYDDTDSNTIYVNSESPGDDSNPGTYSSPKQTLLAAINATTSTKTKVVVQDDATIFNEDISGGTFTYLQGIYQESTGGTSSWVARQLGFTPDDTNAIWVSKAGADDTGADGTRANPYLSINYAKDYCDTGKDVIVIDDSGTYEEEGFAFTGNFTGLYAAIGEAPTIEFVDNIDNFDISESVAKTLFDNSGAFTGTRMGCCTNTNGDIILTYTISSRVYFKVYDKNWNVITNKTMVEDENSGSSSCVRMSDGNILVMWPLIAGGTRYKIYNYNMSAVVTTVQTLALFTISNFHTIKILTGNRILIASSDGADGDKGKYVVISEAFATVKTTTTYHNAATSGAAIEELDNGKILIVYCDKGDSDKIKYVILNGTTYSEETAETLLINAATLYYHDVIKLENGTIFVIYGKAADNHIYYTILNEDLTSTIIAETSYLADTAYFVPSASLNVGGHVVISIQRYDSGVTYYGYYSELYASIYHLSNNVEATISGILLTASDLIYLDKFINSSAAIYLNNIEIYDCETTTDDVSCIAISSDSHVDITYSKIHDCDIGVDTTEDTSDFFDSQFYRINEGYAIDVDGAAGTGAGINIEHCDFFDCYGGIRLQNNDGGEEIKNCIFHDCSVYAIDAEVALTITYCCVTSSVTSTVTLGSYVNRGNPDYMNEGYTDPDDTDLNLRVKVIGYPGNSAAYALADDSRNAGAIDVKYIGTETTYTSITVPKPNQMKHEYVYAGATNTQRKDGSWTSFKDGQSEVLTMTWDGIAAAYMTQLITMWKSSEYVVLIYPDPVTYPTSFEQWTLIRESLNNSVGTPTLSDLGAQSVTLKFAKAA